MTTSTAVTPGADTVPGVTPFRCDHCTLTGFEVVCAQCGRGFIARNSTARYCSTRCRVAAHRAES